MARKYIVKYINRPCINCGINLFVASIIGKLICQLITPGLKACWGLDLDQIYFHTFDLDKISTQVWSRRPRWDNILHPCRAGPAALLALLPTLFCLIIFVLENFFVFLGFFMSSCLSCPCLLGVLWLPVVALLVCWFF